jgi:hypothetical protein
MKGCSKEHSFAGMCVTFLPREGYIWVQNKMLFLQLQNKWRAYWKISADEQFSQKNDDFCFRNSLTISGSDQAREGRLVDALAVRGDEGRDTLR